MTNVAVFGTYLVVAGFLAFVLWQSLFGSRYSIEKPSKPEANQSEQQHADKQLTGGSLAPQPHSPAEQAIADYTRWLAVFTALLVLATVALFVSGENNVEVARETAKAALKQAEAMQRQLALMEADQRPWLKAQFEILKPLVFDAKGLQLELSGKTINVGKLPAFNAELYPLIVTITAGIDLAKTQKEFCENIIKNVRKDKPGGTIIFPGDHIINSPITRGFSPEEIERGKTMLGFNPPDFKRDFFGIVLTGCIVYAFPGQKDSKPRMTGFGYQFHTSKSFGIDTRKGTIPVDEMAWFVVPELTWAN